MPKHGQPLQVEVEDGFKLTGRSFDVRQLDSVAILLVDEPSLSGLYRLGFSNGESYVGQAVNVVRRFADHKRTYNDIVQFEFFPVSIDKLTTLEKALIHTTELKGPVRNKKDAHQPLGNKTIEVEVAIGETVLLPWERKKRIRPGDATISRERRKFFKLATHERYSDIREIAGWYLYNLIPDPFNTQKHLWVSTCLPSTNRSPEHQRLAVINTGALETLCIIETVVDEKEGPFIDLFINTAIPDQDIGQLQSKDFTWSVDIQDYKYGSVAQWFFSIDGLLAVIRCEMGVVGTGSLRCWYHCWA